MIGSETLVNAGVVGVIATVLAVAGAKGVWVWGHMHRAAIARLEEDLARERAATAEWKDLSLRLAGVTEQAVGKAASVVYDAARTEERRR